MTRKETYESWKPSGLLEGLEEEIGTDLSLLLESLGKRLSINEEKYSTQTIDNSFVVFRKIFSDLLDKRFSLDEIKIALDENVILDGMESVPEWDSPFDNHYAIDYAAEVFGNFSEKYVANIVKYAS